MLRQFYLLLRYIKDQSINQTRLQYRQAKCRLAKTLKTCFPLNRKRKTNEKLTNVIKKIDTEVFGWNPI